MFLAQGPASTIVVAVLYGLFGGFATAAYIDLIMRSCPKGLEGTAMMVSQTSAFALAGNSGNLLGSWIYSKGGFASAVIITTLATALIVPVLRSDSGRDSSRRATANRSNLKRPDKTKRWRKETVPSATALID